MHHVQFDSFGERIPETHSHVVNHRQAPRRVLLAGASFFWALVVVIVSARAVYFDTDFASKLAQFASQSSRSILALLGG